MGPHGTYSLERREDGQREGSDLDGASDDVRDNEHEHSHLACSQRDAYGGRCVLSSVCLTCHLLLFHGGRRRS